MHISNVNEYAPAGYQLSKSEYENGECVHTFAGSDGSLKLLAIPGGASKEKELTLLEAFRSEHAETVSRKGKRT